MRTLTRILTAAVLFCVGAASAADPAFSITESVTLSSEAHAITVQQPTSGSKKIKFHSATMYCASACTVTLERDGTAATATAGTIVTLDETNNTTPTATAWTASDVGAGTAIHIYEIAAGGSITIDMSLIKMSGNGATKNVSLRTASMSGLVRRNIVWVED